MAASTTTNNSCYRSPASATSITPCETGKLPRMRLCKQAACTGLLLHHGMRGRSANRYDGCFMINYSWVDVFALGFFILEWTTYAITLEHTKYGRDSLSARMHAYREVWMRRLLEREARIVDTHIITSLQNGTAWFASTTLIAIGGSLALLRATNEVMPMMQNLPLGFNTTPGMWEIKCFGLILIFVYAFFKFAWSYRLFNYVAILIGAMPF